MSVKNNEVERVKDNLTDEDNPAAEIVETVKELINNSNFAKQEEVQQISGKLDEIQGQINAAPAFIKDLNKKDLSLPWEKVSEKESKVVINLHSIKKSSDYLELVKQYNVTTGVAGEAQASAMVYFGMVQGNPFRGASFEMPMNSSVINLPELSGITAAHESAIPDTINTASGHGGTVTSKQLQAQNWTTRSKFSDSSIEDLVGLDSQIGRMIGQQLGSVEASDQVAQIKTAVNAGSNNIERVASGGATAFPTTINPWSSMMASLSTSYKPFAKWMMSREAMDSLRRLSQSGTGSPLVVDPSTGGFNLWGYPIIINDYLENASTGNNLLALFGDFSLGTIIGSRKEMIITRHEATIPGAYYYYGNMRSRGADWDRNALVALRAAAS